jgi:hypothetical protein
LTNIAEQTKQDLNFKSTKEHKNKISGGERCLQPPLTLKIPNPGRSKLDCTETGKRDMLMTIIVSKFQ